MHFSTYFNLFALIAFTNALSSTSPNSDIDSIEKRWDDSRPLLPYTAGNAGLGECLASNQWCYSRFQAPANNTNTNNSMTWDYSLQPAQCDPAAQCKTDFNNCTLIAGNKYANCI